MAEFFKVLRYEEAVQRIIENFPPQQTEMVSLSQAAGRFLAGVIRSPEDQPPFTRSTVDGYAVAAADTFGSSESLPAFLDFTGEIKMGQAAEGSLPKGGCMWIPTGGMLPGNADAVVMVEYTERLGEDTILVYRPVAPGENVMNRGEDIKREQSLLPAGKFLRPQDIGLLASLGIDSLKVFGPYRVGIISTGDEIVNIDSLPRPGEIRDVNTYALAAALEKDGNAAVIYPLVKDNRDDLKATAEQALAENDVVLISGGSSVGIMDVTLDVLMEFPEAQLLLHGVAVKPGKPTLAVRIGKKIVIGLPGHPVSALTIFHVLCRPALYQGQGISIPAVLTMNVASQAGRDDFIPVKLTVRGGEYQAEPLLGKSGLMSIMALADAYIRIPYEQQGLLKGEKVQAVLY